jgi:hypothetical protein
VNPPALRWYYFVLGKKGGLQMYGAPYMTRREAEEALAGAGRSLLHPMSYRILEGRIAPDLDDEIASGITEPSGRVD